MAHHPASYTPGATRWGVVSELSESEHEDALWDAITWYAFVDGVMARSEQSEHVKGAYTIFAAPGVEDQSMAFSRPGSQGDGANPPN